MSVEIPVMILMTEKETPKLCSKLHSLRNSCVYPNSANLPSSCILKLISEEGMVLLLLCDVLERKSDGMILVYALMRSLLPIRTNDD